LIVISSTRKTDNSSLSVFYPNNAHFCHDFLQQKGYDIELAYEAGLLSRNEENFSYYDRYQDYKVIVSFEKSVSQDYLNT
jgi:hypothetical protein